MNSIDFVYCFSRKLASTEEQYKISLQLFKESIQLSSKFYNTKVYTDTSTVKDLQKFNTEIVNLGELELIFVDDFKLIVLDLLKPNEILIDTDVLIYDNLNVDLEKDLIFDFIDLPESSWYRNCFSRLSNTDIKEYIHTIAVPDFIPNIGFLKFNNYDLYTEYKNQYNIVRDKIIPVIDSDTNFGEFSLLLGQYLLGAVLKQGNFSYFNISSQNRPTTYRHLSGPIKFRKQELI